MVLQNSFLHPPLSPPRYTLFLPCPTYSHVYRVITGGDAQVRSWQSSCCWAELSPDKLSFFFSCIHCCFSLRNFNNSITIHPTQTEELYESSEFLRDSSSNWTTEAICRKYLSFVTGHPVIIICVPNRQNTLWFNFSVSPTQRNNKVTKCIHQKACLTVSQLCCLISQNFFWFHSFPYAHRD